MSENITEEGEKRKRQNTKLNTSGCCFLCLTIINIKTEEKSNDVQFRNSVSLKKVRLYLRINTEKLNASSKQQFPNSELRGKEEIEADLCEQCERITSKFSKAFASLEAIQLEVNYWLERIHLQISEASKKHELVQNYSKRMTSDPETLTELLFVDNLRKEIRRKASETKTKWELEKPKVNISRLANVEKYLANSCRHQGTPKPPPLYYQFEECQLTDDFQGDANDSLSLPTEDAEHDKPAKLPSTTANDDGGYITNTPRNRVRHSNAANPYYKKSETSGTFDCLACNKKCKSRQAIYLHNISVHLGRRYKCELCGEASYTRLENLTLHKTLCGNNNSLKIKNDMSKARIKMRAESGSKCAFNPKTKTYDCSVCKKGFRAKSSAWYHYNITHSKTEYKCGKCNIAIFKQHRSFLRHQLSCRGAGGSKKGPQKLSRREDNLLNNKTQQQKLSENIKSELNGDE